MKLYIESVFEQLRVNVIKLTHLCPAGAWSRPQDGRHNPPRGRCVAQCCHHGTAAGAHGLEDIITLSVSALAK